VVKHPLLDTEILKYSFSIQEVLIHQLVFREVLEHALVVLEGLKHAVVVLEGLKHALVVLEGLKQERFNTGRAETSTCVSRGMETSNLTIRRTKTYQLIFEYDRNLISLETMVHIRVFMKLYHRNINK
jgi:hypothetical protein